MIEWNPQYFYLT